MDRAQFMEQLKRLLMDISEAERQEALEYYENYFEDAGAENEEKVIRELGSPGKVAAIIKADLKENNDRYAEYTENGYEDTRANEEKQHPEKYRTGTREGRGSRAERGYHAKPRRSNAAFILILILLVFLSPAIVGGFGGILGVAVSLLLLPFLLIFALGFGTIGLLIGGIVCIVTGIGLCFSFPASGVLTIGVGCLVLAAGLLFLVLLVWLAGKFLPKLMRKFTNFCGGVLRRERKDGAEV